MAQMQERKNGQPAIVRSEQFVDRMGQNIGSFAALTRQRFVQTAMRAEEGLASIQTGLTTQSEVVQDKLRSQLDGKGAGEHVPTEGSPQAEMQRAERVVDVMGQRLTVLTSNVGFQLRKMAAYAYEGAEDIWAEAQHMRPTRNH